MTIFGISDSRLPNLEGQVPVFISPTNRVAQLYPQALGSLFVSPTTRRATVEPESEPYITTDGQSASLSWNKAPIWGLRPDFYYCRTIAGLLMWGALSNECTGLFTIAAGPRQRSHSRVRVPWDSPPYFTVSDSKLPFSSPLTTRRPTVEVFDLASTRGWTAEIFDLSLHSFGRTEWRLPPSRVSVLSLSFKKSLPWICLCRNSVATIIRCRWNNVYLAVV
jgi:hypothetical protein